MKNKKSFTDLQSQTINFLRFPLIVGVLFIHNFEANIIIPGAEFGADTTLMPVFYYCSNFFSQVLARVAVPLFFFISGFLFFLNVDRFNQEIYRKKLLTRAKTLLVPYLLWNLLAMGIFLIINTQPSLKGFIKFPPKLQDILPLLWAMEVGGHPPLPIANQFWFVRDLMIMAILTPIIYWVCKRAKRYGVVLLGTLWFFGWWFGFVEDRGLSIVALFFFTAGAYFSINKRNLITDMNKIKHLSFVLYPLLAFADLFTRQYAFNTFIHQAGILFGIVFLFNMVAFLLKSGKVKVNEFLSAASFFVFAIHEPILLRSLRKIMYMIFRPETDIAITSLYFLNVIIVILVALALYAFMKRFIPNENIVLILQ